MHHTKVMVFEPNLPRKNLTISIVGPKEDRIKAVGILTKIAEETHDSASLNSY